MTGRVSPSTSRAWFTSSCFTSVMGRGLAKRMYACQTPNKMIKPTASLVLFMWIVSGLFSSQKTR